MSWITDAPTAPTLTVDTVKLKGPESTQDAPARRDTDPDITVPEHQPGGASGSVKPNRPEAVLVNEQTNARVYVATDLAKIYVDRAMKRHDQGDVEGAIGDYTEAIKRSPKHPVATYNRGVALLALGRAEEATVDFLRVLELAPELPEAYYNLAISLMTLGQARPALDHARRAVTLFATRGDTAMHENAHRLVTQIQSVGP